MSMDALTSAALDSLHKNSLPKLLKALAELHALAPEKRLASSILKTTISESSELLALVLKWIEESSNPEISEMSDDDAQMLRELADTEGTSGASGALEASSEMGGDTDITMGGDTDITMGGDTDITMGGDTDITMGGDTDITMGDDTSVSDDEAMRMLAEMDSPVAPAPSGDVSDDEAMRMLAEMDSPVAPAPSGEVSDDEAMRMLAEMDAPAPVAPVAAKPISAKPISAKPATAPTKNSADDDAMALLASLGGSDEASAPAPKPTKVAAPVHAAPAPHGSGEETVEGPEWESNDFASDPEMMNDFSTNTADIMQNLDDQVLKLEQNPTNKDTIEEIFRAAHTLKGAAGMFGFRAIERVMHRMESLFDNVRKGKLVANADTIDAVFQGLDCLKKLLAAVLAQVPSGMKISPIVNMLERACNGQPSGASRQGADAEAPANDAAEPTHVAAAASGNSDDHGAPSGGGGAPKKKNEAASTIRVDLERLDALVNLIGELVIDRTRFVNIDESLRSQAPQLKLAGNLTETLQQFGRHMNEVQDIIMKVRMVPVGSVFNKYPRVVRDLARQLNKKIDLVLFGEETEFDKTLVEQIADPLVHLIRNACDHGVETPAERQASGKSAQGTVTLGARQEGNHIFIQITDDGKGMDVNRIKAKGIEKGLISADQTLTDRDIFNLIFEPGFSTAEKLTTVSGRGVGMDVVRKQISKLKGSVEIASAPGKGSTITIQLPLTLAIMQSLLVGIQEEVLAIPLNAVIESIRIKPSDIQTVGNSEVIKLRNSVLPLLYLDDVLGLNAKQDDYWYRHPDHEAKASILAKRRQKREERLFVVVVGSADRRYGLVVDALLNQQEMVIKPLGVLMRGTPCVAGGAVLGSGEVVLVLDVPEIENHHRAKVRKNIAA